MSDPALSRRRTILAAGGLLAGSLAGCSTDGSDPAGRDSPTAETPGETSTSETAAGPDAVALDAVATGFQAPVDLVDPAIGDHLLVADQLGLISTVGPDGGVEPFLDLRDHVVTGGERGLLGLALHPEFEANHRLYVRYSAPRLAGTPASFDHTFVLSEFVAREDGRQADPDSERRLLTIPEPQSNHNAGAITFGPDDYLYVAVGDGGGGDDVGTGHASDWYGENRGGNGQDVTNNLLGSILRIDVDDEEPDQPYGIPDDNPLVGEVGLNEHWAWGFRNPWRMSFDGDDLYVGDVGQNRYEEIDIVRRGGNYGWNVKEGTHCFDTENPLEPPAECPDETPEGEPLIDPIVEYSHSGSTVSGISVIGGYVHRGETLPGLDGRYVFGDLNPRGRLFVARRPEGDGLWPIDVVEIAEGDAGTLSQLLSFGRDTEDRLYVLGIGDDGGGVYELRTAE